MPRLTRRSSSSLYERGATSVGTPRGDVVDTWQDAIRAKFDVEVYEEMFCRRLPDERLWYAEQPEGAKLVDLDDSLSSSQAL